jgi:hypothetical protein
MALVDGAVVEPRHLSASTPGAKASGVMTALSFAASFAEPSARVCPDTQFIHGCNGQTVTCPGSNDCSGLCSEPTLC